MQPTSQPSSFLKFISISSSLAEAQKGCMKTDMERTTTAMKTFECSLPPKSPILRDRAASFSSYLNPQKPNTRTLEDPTSELSIFDAHKYFNELTNNENIQKVTISSNNSNNNNNNNNNSRVSPVVVNLNNETEHIVIPDNRRYSSASSTVDSYSNIRNYRARSFHTATPTASSEASWNSQQGLLSQPAGAISVNIKNPSNPIPNNNNNTFRTSLSKPIWLLRRKCPCTGKKSVQVKEKKSTALPKNSIKIPSPVPPSPPPPPINNWVNNNMDQTQTPNLVTKSQRFQPVVTTVRVPYTEGFTFPVLNPNSTSTTAKLSNGVVLEDPPRESLEVFQPPDELKVDMKSLNFPFPPPMSRIIVDDGDAASDASSDLFEIESFSTATQSSYAAAAYRRNSRDSFDEGSVTTAMTECYEPSEASIEWSVTTADGYDESIYSGGVGSGGSSSGTGGGVTAEHWKRKGGNGGLLVSCRCEKAVSVGPQPIKCEGQRGATSAWKNVNGSVNSRAGGVNKPPLARSSLSHRNNNSNNNTPRVTSFSFAT
ncbi:protein PHYTOCHROME KINASE SUBSTRATE 4 [Vicia villosa]|uniref:protein PHYTOCHROME KINASE SUBSTRATE 4 n=1 Tax=Vicia villosa TaxID=3911 RepID=UPI00273CA465|nr:protein PHYTOCHROME KINASE SUBSTRATE 4 [Vicia villosa]